MVVHAFVPLTAHGSIVLELDDAEDGPKLDGTARYAELRIEAVAALRDFPGGWTRSARMSGMFHAMHAGCTAGPHAAACREDIRACVS